MNYLWVAYNRYGDLVAEACSYSDLEWRLELAGYDVDEVFLGRVTP